MDVDAGGTKQNFHGPASSAGGSEGAASRQQEHGEKKKHEAEIQKILDYVPHEVRETVKGLVEALVAKAWSDRRTSSDPAVTQQPTYVTLEINELKEVVREAMATRAGEKGSMSWAAVAAGGAQRGSSRGTPVPAKVVPARHEREIMIRSPSEEAAAMSAKEIVLAVQTATKRKGLVAACWL